jgi:hypothetical protein
MSQQFYMPRSRVLASYVDHPELANAQTLNMALPWWGYVVAMAVTRGGYDYRIRKAYVEFKNVTNPSDLAPLPTVTQLDPASALPYYAALGSTPQTDFLRVDLRGTPEIDVETGYEGYFPEGAGNLIMSFAQTEGSVGVHGLPFSDVNNSKIFGTALVACPNESDYTQDIVVARAYFSGSQQLLKLPGMQIGVSWESPFLVVTGE